ncbi:MAG: class I SAM-dependent methyltransferase [Pseudomonadota bacterium]
MSLRERLRAEIAQTGPIGVAEYMNRCLNDPLGGYYATRPALGEAGDFITAPMVSQMFGELLGVWAVETWTRMGKPAPFRLVEMGPGDGALMSDLLRAVRLAPDFIAAADLWLVETSAPLRAAQRARLAGATPAPAWAASLDELPAGAPVILIANELIDCLPARQYVRVGDAWVERLVGLGEDGDLAFGLGPSVAAPASGWSPSPPGREEPGPVLEVSAAQEAMGAALGALIAREGGVALLIDYGRDRPEFGDTLQALKGHEKVDPLAFPGESDLTVYADFPTVRDAARAAGAAATDAIPQGLFLGMLGIQHRAEALKAARPDRADVIDRQLTRLVSPDEMGQLFKAACIHSPGVVPPGFEASA